MLADAQHPAPTADVGTRINLTTLDARRATLRSIFSQVWLEKRELKAVTPRGIFLPLIGVHHRVRMGWLMGVNYPIHT